MKKLGALIVGLSLVAGAVLAANPVTSVNVVGFVQSTVGANKFKSVGWSFNVVGASGGAATIGQILGTNGIPDLTAVYIWNGMQYIGESYYDGIGWDPGTNLISRGDGFWISSPDQFVVTTSGEVPSTMAASTTNALAHGYQMLCYPYPVAIDLTNSSLNSIATDLDSIYVWTGSNYVGYSYYDGIGWDPGMVMKPGEGFWYYREGSSATWVENKPYSTP